MSTPWKSTFLYFYVLLFFVFIACDNEGSYTDDGIGNYNETYTLKLNSNNGSGDSESFTVYAGYKILPTSKFTYDGHIFLGWAKKGNATQVDYNVGDKILVESNLSLYALWVDENKTYAITFNSNGGTGEMEQVTAKFGQKKLPASNFTKVGYRFLGWAKVPDATQVLYEDGETIDVKENLTLYALWKKDTRTIVSLDAGDFIHVKLQDATYYPKTFTVDLSVGQADAGVRVYLMNTSQYNDFLENKNSFSYTMSTLSCDARVKKFNAMAELKSDEYWHYVIYNPNPFKSQTVYYEITEGGKIDASKIFNNTFTLDGNEYLYIKLEDSYYYSAQKTFNVNLTSDGSGVKAYLMSEYQLTTFKKAIKDGGNYDYTESKLSIDNKVKKFNATDKPGTYNIWYYVIYNPNLTQETVTLKITSQ